MNHSVSICYFTCTKVNYYSADIQTHSKVLYHFLCQSYVKFITYLIIKILEGSYICSQLCRKLMEFLKNIVIFQPTAEFCSQCFRDSCMYCLYTSTAHTCTCIYIYKYMPQQMPLGQVLPVVQKLRQTRPVLFLVS